MNLKKIVSKSIASFMVTVILFGNFSMCGMGISKVIAEDVVAPGIEFQIENQKYVQYNYAEIVQEEVAGENEGETVMQDVEKQIAGVAVQSKLSVKPIQVVETYLPTQNVNLSVSLPKINEYLPVRATVVIASTEYTTGEESKNINQSYDATTGLLSISYENVSDEQGNIYANFNENAKDEFEIIYIYPAEAYVGNEADTVLNYAVYAEMVFVTENGTVESIDEQSLELTEKDNKEDISSFKVTSLKENIYKGFMYSNTENKTSHDTEFTTVSTFAVLNSDIAKEYILEENANRLILKGEEKAVVSANGNVVYNSTTILKSEFDRILGRENSFVEFYQDEDIYATVGYVDIDDTKKIAITYKDAEPIILEDGVNEIVVNYPENITALKIKISKPIAEGFINFENKNKIKASEDYGYDVKDIKSILVTTMINEKSGEAELILSEPSTKVSINSSNVNFSTLQQSNTTLTINLDDTNITTKLFDAPTLIIKLPKGIEKFNVTKIDMLNGNGLTIKGHKIVNNTIVIQLAGAQTDFDFNNVSGGVNIVVYINNIDYADTIPTHSDKIELICSQDNVQAECNVNIVSKPGLLMLSKVSGYDNNSTLVTMDNEMKEVQIANGDVRKEVTQKIILVNNYSNDLENFELIGRVGYINSEVESTFDANLTKEIIVNKEDTEVYYSDNKDAEYNDESWYNEFSTNAKAYKIVFKGKKLSSMGTVTALVSLEIPEDLEYNQVTAIKTEVKYDGQDKEEVSVFKILTPKAEETDLYKINSVSEFQDVENYDMDLGVSITIGGEAVNENDTVNEGQILRYNVVLKNNEDREITDLNIQTLLENAVYYEITVIGDASGRPATGYKEAAADDLIRNKTINIGANETILLDYQVVVKENVDRINNTIKVIKDDVVLCERQISNNVRETQIKLKVESEYNEEHLVTTKSELGFKIVLTNLTDREVKNIKISCDLPEELNYDINNLEQYFWNEEEMNVFNKIEKQNNTLYWTINKLEANDTKTIYVRPTVDNLDNNVVKKDLTIIAIAEYSSEGRNKSNDLIKTIYQRNTQLNATLTQNIENNSILKNNDEVVLNLTLKNAGNLNLKNVNINMSASEGFIFKKYLYNNNENTINLEQLNIEGIEIASKDTVEFVIYGKVQSEKDNVENIIIETQIDDDLGNSIDFEELTYKVEIPKVEDEELGDNNSDDDMVDDNIDEGNEPVLPDESEDMENDGMSGNENSDGVDNPGTEGDDNQNPDENEDPDPTPDQKPEDDKNEEEKPEDDKSQEPSPEIPVNKYTISGKAWLDVNKNGQKDSDEKVMENIQISLVDKATGKFALDEAGNKIKTITNSNGEYNFENVKEGTYVVVFEFDTNKYVVTTYQKTNINQDVNSDAILIKLNIDGQEKLAGVTDDIELRADKVNIDIGLMENAIFDLSLEKTISKITVINLKGTETTEYEDGETAKVDLVAKYMNGAEVIVTYKFTVKNEGDTLGYVDKLVDNLPSGLEFSSELNSNWYKGSDNQLYTTSLSGKAIKPGETAEVELVLTKKMTENNTGVFPNNAELVEISNLENIKEKEDALENNKSSAMLIISIKTGSVILYTGITIISILIIIAGAYIIKKKILNRGI